MNALKEALVLILPQNQNFLWKTSLVEYMSATKCHFQLLEIMSIILKRVGVRTHCEEMDY